MPQQQATPAKRTFHEIRPHIQIASFLKWAWPADLPWTHFPAGEMRDEDTLRKLCAMGLNPGWGDFQFVLPNAQFATMEVKRQHGQMSEAQIAHRERLITLKAGHALVENVADVRRVGARWLARFGRELNPTPELWRQ